MRNTLRTRLLAASTAALLVAGVTFEARAEADDVRFAEQFGLLYLPMHVVVDQKLVQSCAKDAGLGDVKVTMHRFSGGAAVNQALLSGNVDFAAGGIGPLLTIWDKTRGSINVRAMSTLAAMPLKLNTNDDRVKTLTDYVGLDDHKIATPSAKVSIQARVLQMAAAKQWGQGEAFKLDDMTVSMKHPSAAAALLAGGQAVKSHFATLPTSWQEVKSGKVRTVLTSYDVLGGRHSTVAMYNTEKWKNENPKLYGCVASSFRKGIEWINADKKRAAGLFHSFTKSKLPLEMVEEMLTTDGEMDYSITPERTMEFAKFLHGVDAIKNLPESWKDFYWENNYDQAGS
ncbi:MAG: ABC transporter substrate-binding protein [Ectothiorhodospiraceae bacterium]|nr:ABC transporter substrate-binding protein [Ectothiorhodospiraceae bacterium]